MYIEKLKQGMVLEYDNAVALTKRGKVRGVTRGTTTVFRGIPYAQARRFHEPEPVENWDGVREAIVYGFASPEISTGVPGDQFTVPHYFCVQSENCQYLNVWTQHLDPEAKRPVMVWFHGGGFSNGSSVDHFAYDGEELSKFGDVVVVSVNHRLSVLGYLDLSAYGAQYRNAGNLGTMDTVAALRWVQENIRNFGGDPDCVTIFGQSGGGGKVTTLMQTPAARGLFHRAILQSGGAGWGTSSNGNEKAGALRVTQKVLGELAAAGVLHAESRAEGTQGGMPLFSAEELAKIETIPYELLARAANNALADLQQEESKVRFGFAPVPGDYYLGDPQASGFYEGSNEIPVLCGSVFSEFYGSMDNKFFGKEKNEMTEAEAEEALRQNFGGDTEKFLADFRAAYPGKQDRDLIWLDRTVRPGVRSYVKKRAASVSAPTYNYLFTFECPFRGGATAYHNSCIPFVFHDADYLPAYYRPGDTERMQDRMSGAWVRFAETGKPGAADLPAWDPCTAEHVVTMILDREPRLVTDHDDKLMAELPPFQSDFLKWLRMRRVEM